MSADDDPLWYDRAEPDAPPPRWLAVAAGLFVALAAVVRGLRAVGARVAALRARRA